jgi:Uma2 family endonuclease
MSRTADPSRTYTADEWLALFDGDEYDLVDGRLEERGSGVMAGLIAVDVGCALMDQLDRQSVVTLAGKAAYRCFPGHPETIRTVSVSCVRRERLSREDWESPFCSIPPDLAVITLKPQNTALAIDAKVADFLGAGTQLVWVVKPSLRRVTAYRPGGSVLLHRDDDELDGEGVFAGLRCGVASFFRQIDHWRERSP